MMDESKPILRNSIDELRNIMPMLVGQKQIWESMISRLTVNILKISAIYALADGREVIAEPYWGLEAPSSYPFGGSLLEYWDSGTLPPPKANITPTESAEFLAECGALSKDEQKKSRPCNDPHEDPRRQPLTIKQKEAFFRPDGKTIDVCDGKPCAATPRFEL